MEINNYLKKIYIPKPGSHKGQNGRLLIIGGSQLFHAASLWALKVASRIVDLVHYSSVNENNKIVQRLKEEFRDGIVVSRPEVEEYIGEDDCILIGPGMVRAEDESRIKSHESRIKNIKDIEEINDEGMQTYLLTKYLLKKYSGKKWVIDAGALQMIDPEWIPKNAILTPHHKEYENLKSKIQNPNDKSNPKFKDQKEEVKYLAKKYKCVILLKGEEDLIASGDNFEIIKGGNAGMTKGGTGDVLTGLVAGLFCKNDAFTSAVSGSYINKKAGEDLYKKNGLWFNASDLADQIPRTMKKLFLS